MLFGRAFEQALSAYFQRDDPGAVLFREWAAHKDSKLEYSNGTTWDRMLQQGIQLLERFAQDGRIRVRLPRKNLHIKFTRPMPYGNDFVSYIDAIGQLDGIPCLLEWKTTSSRYPEEPQGLPHLICYRLDRWHLGVWSTRRSPWTEHALSDLRLLRDQKSS
jgi:hypothetical protein